LFTFPAPTATLSRMEPLSIDVLVIGSGGAGLRAAIAAAEEGCKTLVISKGTPALGTATLMSDGFFASSGHGLSPADHATMTQEIGYHLNKPEMVKVFCEETPARLHELQNRGVPFMAGPGGIRAPKVRLGRMIVPKALMAWAIEVGVTFLGWTTATDLLTDDGRVVGCIGLSKGRPVSLRAKATVLCTGGASGLFLFHDNPMTNIGDGLGLAARAGATLRDMEFAQFYPFVTNQPGAPQVLLAPPLSDIGRIINDQNEDLVEKYGLAGFIPLGVKARDRLSRALFQEHLSGRYVFLDLRSMTNDDWKHPNAGEQLRSLLESRFHCASAPLPIMPVAHFTMGGVEIDDNGWTGKAGLFAAGEVAHGLHGANRMGGNALSETLVFGARAGRAAAEYARSLSLGSNMPVSQGREIANPPQGASPLSILKRLKETLWKYCGPVRTGVGLRQGIKIIENLKQEKLVWRNTADVTLANSLENAFHTALNILEAALARRNSLGAHYRED
jgi:fumarate reductase (CoM/CoB) subunit A